MPPGIEMIDAAVGARIVAMRSVDTSDPTLTGCADRSEAGHKLTVTIGTDPGNFAYYIYDDQTGKWVPESVCVRFPDFSNHKVSLKLSGSAADPIAAQKDATAQQLLDADVAVCEIANQTPVKSLASATLSHANTLFEMNFDAALDPAMIRSVKVNKSIAAYDVTVAGEAGKFLVIIAPGDSEAAVTLDYNGVEYTRKVKAGTDAESVFMKNTRYAISLAINTGGLVCGDVSICPWEESGGGVTDGSSTKFRIVGYENQTLDVKIEGADTFAGILTLDANGEGSLPFISLPDYGVDIEYVRKPGHPQIAIDKPLGSQIELTVDPATGIIVPNP